MGTRSSRSRPRASASRVEIVHVADAPGRVACSQVRVEGSVALCGVRTADPIGAIGEKRRARREQARGAVEEREARLEGGDVDHVDAEDGVGLFDGPRGLGHVEAQGRAHIVETLVGGPGGDARAARRLGIARLEGPPRKPLGEEDRVLSRAARDLEEGPAGWQDALEHGQDGAAVALGGGEGEARIARVGGFHGPMVRPCVALATGRRGG